MHSQVGNHNLVGIKHWYFEDNFWWNVGSTCVLQTIICGILQTRFFKVEMLV